MSFYAQQIFTLLNGCTNFLQLHLRRSSTFQELVTHDLFRKKLSTITTLLSKMLDIVRGTKRATFFCLT